ncbi:hypothetical protein HDU85_004691 [Gaertneriomyces sp. JEL0708]|nr:hypothetical protein HDU85_004691 [Gaertneriomyces sp. JEL0708]
MAAAKSWLRSSDGYQWTVDNTITLPLRFDIGRSRYMYATCHIPRRLHRLRLNLAIGANDGSGRLIATQSSGDRSDKGQNAHNATFDNSSYSKDFNGDAVTELRRKIQLVEGLLQIHIENSSFDRRRMDANLSDSADLMNNLAKRLEELSASHGVSDSGKHTAARTTTERGDGAGVDRQAEVPSKSRWSTFREKVLNVAVQVADRIRSNPSSGKVASAAHQVISNDEGVEYLSTSPQAATTTPPDLSALSDPAALNGNMLSREGLESFDHSLLTYIHYRLEAVGLKPYITDPYHIYFISDTVNAAKFMEAVNPVIGGKVRHIGFDCETSGANERVRLAPSMVQIAFTEHLVAIFQLYPMCYSAVTGKLDPTRLPSSLRDFIQSGNILKVGVGIRGDMQRLKDHYKINAVPWSVIDLGDISKSLGVPGGSLKDLTLQYCGILLEKTKSNRFKSDVSWDSKATVIGRQQVLYAANDAMAGLRVFRAMFQVPKPINIHDPHPLSRLERTTRLAGLKPTLQPPRFPNAVKKIEKRSRALKVSAQPMTPQTPVGPESTPSDLLDKGDIAIESFRAAVMRDLPAGRLSGDGPNVDLPSTTIEEAAPLSIEQVVALPQTQPLDQKDTPAGLASEEASPVGEAQYEALPSLEAGAVSSAVLTEGESGESARVGSVAEELVDEVSQVGIAHVEARPGTQASLQMSTATSSTSTTTAEMTAPTESSEATVSNEFSSYFAKFEDAEAFRLFCLNGSLILRYLSVRKLVVDAFPHLQPPSDTFGDEFMAEFVQRGSIVYQDSLFKGHPNVSIDLTNAKAPKAAAAIYEAHATDIKQSILARLKAKSPMLIDQLAKAQKMSTLTQFSSSLRNVDIPAASITFSTTAMALRDLIADGAIEVRGRSAFITVAGKEVATANRTLDEVASVASKRFSANATADVLAIMGSFDCTTAQPWTKASLAVNLLSFLKQASSDGLEFEQPEQMEDYIGQLSQAGYMDICDGDLVLYPAHIRPPTALTKLRKKFDADVFLGARSTHLEEVRAKLKTQIGAQGYDSALTHSLAGVMVKHVAALSGGTMKSLGSRIIVTPNAKKEVTRVDGLQSKV